jgi:ribosomal protein S18 acetylase RimI-like enzyme
MDGKVRYMRKEQIINEIYKYNTEHALKGYTKKYSKKWLTKALDKGDLIYIEDNNEVLAYACAYFFPEEIFVNLAILGVNPKYLHKSYGMQILNQFIKKFGSQTIVLNVSKENPIAIKFYKKMGLKIIKSLDDKYLMKI